MTADKVGASQSLSAAGGNGFPAAPSRPPLFRSFWFGAAVILTATAALYLVRLGDRGVISEEARWAEVAREMRAAGNYLHPAINGRTYYDKPLGSYWLIVAASHLTGGVNETAARLPAAVAGWLGVLLVLLLGRRLYGNAAGLTAAANLATSLGYALYARRATADVETVTGVLLCVWLYDRHRDRPDGPWVIGLWLVMAVNSLTKGLLGFVLPGVVLTVHGTWEGVIAGSGVPTIRQRIAAIAQGNRWFFNRWTLAAIPLGISIYLLPFMLSAWQTGATDGLAMVWRENVRRFVAPHNHVSPVYLYIGVVFVLAAPWSAFLPAALIRPRDAGSSDRLALAYFWAVFAFFTAAASRRSYYLLPVLPAAALLIGQLLTLRADALRPAARWLRSVGWVVLAGVVLASGVVLIPAGWRPEPYHRLPDLPFRGAFAVGWVIGLTALTWAAIRSDQRLVALAAAIAFAGLGYTFGIALPASEEFRTGRAFASAVNEITAADRGKLALFHARDAVFDLGGPAPEYSSAEELAAALRDGRVRWVLARRRYLAGIDLPAQVLQEEPVQPWEGPDQVGDKLVLLVRHPPEGP